MSLTNVAYLFLVRRHEYPQQTVLKGIPVRSRDKLNGSDAGFERQTMEKKI
jgi:hypothetical protein